MIGKGRPTRDGFSRLHSSHGQLIIKKLKIDKPRLNGIRRLAISYGLGGPIFGGRMTPLLSITLFDSDVKKNQIKNNTITEKVITIAKKNFLLKNLDRILVSSTCFLNGILKSTSKNNY